MNFIYKEGCFEIFFSSIASMIEENYAFLYNNEYTVSLARHNFDDISKIKEKNPQIKKLIAYQLEPLVPGHWWNTEKIVENIRLADEIWDYDLQNIQILKNYGINAKFRPILYSKKLETVKNIQEPDIDLLFFGTLTTRRSHIINYIQLNSSFRVATLCNFEGQDLEYYIARSKIILNIHANDHHRQEQTRISHMLNNNKCVISEKSNINYFNDLIFEASGLEYAEIGHSILLLATELLSNNKWKNFSNNLSNKLKLLDTYKKQKIILENLNL